ncbi:MAG: hypothetical protein ACWGQW_09980, partial [bacterium]
IMSYSCTQVWCPRIQYFSNPYLSYAGEAAGIESERENWRVLNDTASIVSDFRHMPNCGPLTSPENLEYPAASSAGEFRISWEPVEPYAAKYTLQRSTSSSFSEASTIYSGSLGFFDEGELYPNSYYYRVRAENCDSVSNWTAGSVVVVGEAPGMGDVDFSTSLPGNLAEPGETFLLIAEATSGSSVGFAFFSSATPTKPVLPFYTTTRNSCIDSCNATAEFSADFDHTTLYFWLDVSSNGETQHRSLSVLVESGSSPPPDPGLDLLFFPYSVNLGSPFPENSYAGVALFNPNDVSIDVQLTAYDVAGEQLETVLLSVLEDHAQIAPMGQTALIPTEIFRRADVASVTATGHPDPVKLFFMLGDYDLNSLDGVAGPLPESDTLYFPLARSNSEEAVALFLFNRTPDAGVGTTFQLYSTSGALVGEAQRSLPAMGTLRETLKQLFGVEKIDGYVKLEASGKVKGFELYSRGKGLSALAAHPSAEGTCLVAPHYFATVGGDTELRLQNLGQKHVDVVVKGYTDSGSLTGTHSFRLPQRESFSGNITELLPIDSPLQEVVTGYLVIDLQGSFLSPPIVSGSVTFTGFAGNTIATLPLVAKGNLKTRFLHVAQSVELNMFTGLAILNPGDAPTEVTVRVYDKAGKLVAEQFLDNLPPHNRIVDLLNSSTFFQEAFQQVGGHIEVLSDKPVMVFALFGDYAGKFLSAIEGQSF